MTRRAYIVWLPDQNAGVVFSTLKDATACALASEPGLGPHTIKLSVRGTGGETALTIEAVDVADPKE